MWSRQKEVMLIGMTTSMSYQSLNMKTHVVYLRKIDQKNDNAFKKQVTFLII